MRLEMLTAKRVVFRFSSVVCCLATGLVLAPAAPAQEYTTDANTVVLLHLNEDENGPVDPRVGPLALDSSGNDYHAVAYGAQRLLPPVPGRFGFARQFGGGGYIGFLLVPNPALAFTTGPFTLELWLKTSQDLTSWFMPLITRPSDFAYGLYLISDGRPCLTVHDWDWHYAVAVSAVPVDDGNWHHVAAVRDATSVRIYVDGILQGTADASSVGALRTTGSDLMIGYPELDGIIDEVRFSNKARSPEEFNVSLTVSIDIKPGSYPNSINLGSGGTVPVAILSTPSFDARTVDPTSVTLAGASVALKGKGTPMASFQDVNGDGLLDLVVHVSTEALQPSAGDTLAVLEGKTFGGTRIRGSDTVRVVP